MQAQCLLLLRGGLAEDLLYSITFMVEVDGGYAWGSYTWRSFCVAKSQCYLCHQA